MAGNARRGADAVMRRPRIHDPWAKLWKDDPEYLKEKARNERRELRERNHEDFVKEARHSILTYGPCPLAIKLREDEGALDFILRNREEFWSPPTDQNWTPPANAAPLEYPLPEDLSYSVYNHGHHEHPRCLEILEDEDQRKYVQRAARMFVGRATSPVQRENGFLGAWPFAEGDWCFFSCLAASDAVARSLEFLLHVSDKKAASNFVHSEVAADIESRRKRIGREEDLSYELYNPLEQELMDTDRLVVSKEEAIMSKVAAEMGYALLIFYERRPTGQGAGEIVSRWSTTNPEDKKVLPIACFRKIFYGVKLMDRRFLGTHYTFKTCTWDDAYKRMCDQYADFSAGIPNTFQLKHVVVFLFKYALWNAEALQQDHEWPQFTDWVAEYAEYLRLYRGKAGRRPAFPLPPLVPQPGKKRVFSLDSVRQLIADDETKDSKTALKQLTTYYDNLSRAVIATQTGGPKWYTLHHTPEGLRIEIHQPNAKVFLRPANTTKSEPTDLD